MGLSKRSKILWAACQLPWIGWWATLLASQNGVVGTWRRVFFSKSEEETAWIAYGTLATVGIALTLFGLFFGRRTAHSGRGRLLPSLLAFGLAGLQLARVEVDILWRLSHSTMDRDFLVGLLPSMLMALLFLAAGIIFARQPPVAVK